jgi:phosphoglucosamine mutase
MTPKWFGTDGIRGQVGRFPMTPGFVMKLGIAAGQVFSSIHPHPVVLIGRDTRQSGEMLQQALTSGMLSSGVTVMDLGVCTTPGVSQLVKLHNATAGVVISASHNPVSENGIKFFDQSGFKLNEVIEEHIEALVEGMPEEMELHPFLGRCIDGRGCHEEYIRSLVQEHEGQDFTGVSIVMDCANGAASSLAMEIFSRAGVRVVCVHASPNGLNINHRAGSEHTRKNPAEMGKLIQLYKADFGVVFDGDADRVVLVDEIGRLIDGDHILGILAGYLDEKSCLVARTVVTTKMRNNGLANYLKAKDLVLIETKVGDKFVTEKLIDNVKAGQSPGSFALGGEQSGHIILLDGQHSTGDGIRTALYMTRVFVESKVKSMSELVGWMVKTPQVIASASVSSKPDLETLIEYRQMVDQVKEDLPGLERIELRYSGTEALFRAMLESNERHTEQELADAAWDICNVVQMAAGTPDKNVEILNCSHGGILIPRKLIRCY